MKKAISILSLIVVLASCKKEKTETPTPAASFEVGFWTGSYGQGASNTGTPYAILFRANGTLRIYANKLDTSVANKAEGTYALTPSKDGFTAGYSYSASPAMTYQLTGTFKNNKTGIEGQWSGGLIFGGIQLAKQ